GAHHAEVLRRADETSGVVRIGVVELGYEDRLDRVAGRGHGDADVVRAVAVDARAGRVGHDRAGGRDRSGRDSVRRAGRELRGADHGGDRALRGGEGLVALLPVADDLQVRLAE